MTHHPIKGTIPCQALEILREAGPDRKFTNGQLLDLLGQPRSWTGLRSALQASVRAGLIKVEGERRSTLWSLGDGTPLPIDDTDQDEPLHDRTQMPVGGVPSIFHLAGALAMPASNEEPKPEVEPAPAPATPRAADLPAAPTCTDSQTRKFECALFSDGRLLLELRDKTTVVLPMEDTKILVAYLDRLSPEVA